MFDMGFAELLLIAVIALIVIGPKRMPEAVRFIGYWLGKFRRSVHNARQEMEREFGLDDIRRDLHNEALLTQLEKERQQIEKKFMDGQKAGDDSADSSTQTSSETKAGKTDETDETQTDKVDPEDEREMLQAFEDFEKEFGIESDGSERPNDKPDRKNDDDPGNTTSQAS